MRPVYTATTGRIGRSRVGARLPAAAGMLAELSATTGPEYWAADGVHPTPAGHAALAAARPRLVT